LGYVGQPLIHAFIDARFRTLGYDVDAKKVDALNRGESYIGHIPSEWLKSWFAMERFKATADSSRLAEADAVLVCVPTPLSETRDPDPKLRCGDGSHDCQNASSWAIGRFREHHLSRNHP